MALTSKDTRNQLPLLRFVNDTAEDRVKTEELGTGCIVYKDIVKVYIRAHGDTKNEVPHIAKDIMYTTKVIEKPVKSKQEVIVTDPDTGKETTMVPNPIYPWLNKLKESLRNKVITQEYHDGCKKRFLEWEKTGSVAVEGTPIATWNAITPAQQKQVMQAEILSIESLATANEDMITFIGFGARALKRKAEIYVETKDINVAADDINKLQEENKKQKAAFDEQKAETDSLKAKMAELIEMNKKANKKGE